MIGIYKYTNKLNGKSYIGQSMNIENRYRQHLYDAQNRAERGTGIDLAIKKYGIDNFDFSILEECPQELLDEREIYWIKYYNSYENGYNRSIGGKVLRKNDHPRTIVNEDIVWEIRELYALHVNRSLVYEMYKDTGISERGFLKIWNNENWLGIHEDVYTEENKKWHKNAIGHSEDQIGLSSLDRAASQSEINNWVQDYNNGMSINAIAKKYNKDNSTIEKYIANPVAITQVKYKGRAVQNIETGQVFKSISAAAKWASCGATTLTRHLAKDKVAGTVPETGEPAHWIELT